MFLQILISLWEMMMIKESISFISRQWRRLFNQQDKPTLTWADSNTKCFWRFTILPFFYSSFYLSLTLTWAGLPHSINTKCSFFAFNSDITASVKVSHPFLLWENALCARTVNTVFNNKTPWSAHFNKQPCLGGSILKSFLISV